MADSIEPDEWYAPTLEYPRYSVQHADVEFRSALYRLAGGRARLDGEPLRTSCDEFEALPWILAAAGYWMFNGVGQRVIREFAYEEDARWIPVEFLTPSQILNGFAVLMSHPEGGDFFSDELTTRTKIGSPIRWVLDRAKLGDRQVLAVPGVASNNLVMRGRVVQALIDAGARGVVLEPARVVPRQ